MTIAMEGGISLEEAENMPLAKKKIIIAELEKINRERQKASKR